MAKKACVARKNVIISLECTQTYTIHKHDIEITGETGETTHIRGRTEPAVKDMKEKTKYFVVREKAVPEVLLKVVEAKRMLDTKRAGTVQEAADRAAKYAEQEDCEKEYEQKMEAAGIQISREPNVLQAEMREASQTLVLDYLVEEYGEDKVKKIWMMLNDKEGKIPEFPDYEKQETPVRTARNSTLEIVNAAK